MSGLAHTDLPPAVERELGMGTTILLAVAILVLAVLLFLLASSSPWLLAGFGFLGLGLASRKIFG